MTVRKILIGDDASTWLPWALRFLAHVKRFTPESTPWTKNVIPASDVLVSVKHTPSGDTVAVSATGGDVIGFAPVTTNGWVSPLEGLDVEGFSTKPPVFSTLVSDGNGGLKATAKRYGSSWGIPHIVTTGLHIPLGGLESVQMGALGKSLNGCAYSGSNGSITVVPRTKGGLSGLSNYVHSLAYIPKDPLCGVHKASVKLGETEKLHIEKVNKYETFSDLYAWVSGYSDARIRIKYSGTLTRYNQTCSGMSVAPAISEAGDFLIPFCPDASEDNVGASQYLPPYEYLRVYAAGGTAVTEEITHSQALALVSPVRDWMYHGGGACGISPLRLVTTQVVTVAAHHVDTAGASAATVTTKITHDYYLCGSKVFSHVSSPSWDLIISYGRRYEDKWGVTTVGDVTKYAYSRWYRDIVGDWSTSTFPLRGYNTAHGKCARTGAGVHVFGVGTSAYIGARSVTNAPCAVHSAFITYKGRVFQIPDVAGLSPFPYESALSVDYSNPGALVTGHSSELTPEGDVVVKGGSGSLFANISEIEKDAYEQAANAAALAGYEATEWYLDAVAGDVTTVSDSADTDSSHLSNMAGDYTVRGHLFNAGGDQYLCVGMVVETDPHKEEARKAENKPFIVSAVVNLTTGNVQTLKSIFDVADHVFPWTRYGRPGGAPAGGFGVYDLDGPV